MSQIQKLDAKFDGVIFKVKDGTIVRPDEYIVFLAKDNSLPDTLEFYRNQCLWRGCDNRQLKAIDDMIARLRQWRANNPERCKNPDIEIGEKLIL